MEETDADTSASGAMNWNALHFAAYGGFADICRILLQRGTLLDSQDSSGNTCLHLAISKESVAIASLLLKYGADFNIKNKQRKTAKELAPRQSAHLFDGVDRVPCKIIPIPIMPSEDSEPEVLVQTVKS